MYKSNYGFIHTLHSLYTSIDSTNIQDMYFGVGDLIVSMLQFIEYKGFKMGALFNALIIYFPLEQSQTLL